VASHLPHPSALASYSTALVVSCWCSPCRYFSRYQPWLPKRQAPRPPCRHGRWGAPSGGFVVVLDVWGCSRCRVGYVGHVSWAPSCHRCRGRRPTDVRACHRTS
jgi:hypothetical protein